MKGYEYDWILIPDGVDLLIIVERQDFIDDTIDRFSMSAFELNWQNDALYDFLTEKESPEQIQDIYAAITYFVNKIVPVHTSGKVRYDDKRGVYIVTDKSLFDSWCSDIISDTDSFDEVYIHLDSCVFGIRNGSAVCLYDGS